MRIRAGASSKWLVGFMLAASLAAGQTAAPPDPPASAAAAPPPTPTPTPAPVWKPFQEFAFLAGSWAGGASAGPRVGGRVARFGPELGGAFYVLHASTILAAEEGGRPEETLEEEGWLSYDREKRRYAATWFFSNGVSAVLDVEFLPDGFRLLSREVVNYEAGTRVRILVQRPAAGDAAVSIDLAPPGKDFVPWLVSTLKKR